MTLVHSAAGAGFAGDRWDHGPAAVEARAGLTGPRSLIFETLAERTLALSRQPGGPARQIALAAATWSPALPSVPGTACGSPPTSAPATRLPWRKPRGIWREIPGPNKNIWS